MTLNHFTFTFSQITKWNNQLFGQSCQLLISQFQQVFAWIKQIPFEKWTQAYDGGKRYGHKTTNLVECMNSVLKGTWSLSICVFAKTTFERTKYWFIERGTKTQSMLRAFHQYSKDITSFLPKNEQQSAMCHVQRYNRENLEFVVRDCGEFQTLRLPCAHF